MAASLDVAPLRVACPACGGAIHPIASRCRHCRSDLSKAVRREAALVAPKRAPHPLLIVMLVTAVAVAIAVPTLL